MKMIELVAAAVIGFIVYFFSRRMDKGEKNKLIPLPVSRWVSDVKAAAAKTGAPWYIILAVLWTESAGDPLAAGSSGEIGLMQLKEIAVLDVEQNFGIDTSGWDTDPVKNILIGSYYLALQFSRTGSWGRAIRAYNQGFRGAQENPELADAYYRKVKSRMDIIS